MQLQRLYRLMNNVKLGNQVFGDFLAGALVIGKNFIAEILPFGVKQHQRIVAFYFLSQAHEHIGKAVNGINRNAVGAGQRRQRVKSAEDVAGTVN